MPQTRRLSFDTERFPFAEIAAATLGVQAFDELPAVVRARRAPAERDAQLTYQDSSDLRALLTATQTDHPLRALYRELVFEVVAPPFGGRIAMTQNPTFRVQLAQSSSVSSWHRDADITSRPDYITAWMPFVDTDATNTLWVERDYGSGDHAPIPVRYGEILLFDGAMLSHGSVENTTDVTRVSMDFRFTFNGVEGAEQVFPDRPTAVSG